MAPFKGAVKKVKSREWTGRYVGGYTLLAIAVFLVAIALLLPSDLLANYLRSMLMSKPLSAAVGTLQEASIDILQAEKEAPNKPQENLSAYDEYVALSIANGWSPTDPVLKLESTIRKYSQVICNVALIRFVNSITIRMLCSVV